MNNDAVAANPHTPASLQDGTYPRPQLVRENWVELGGDWGFEFDDDRVGVDAAWFLRSDFNREITVPFPFESPASGIGDSGFHPVVWYSLDVDRERLTSAGSGERTLLHFGAVDYRASVWLNGHHLGDHEGGHTPFSFDVTHTLVDGSQHLVVRAEDDPLDIGQPRGKQDWQRDPHVIWYHRTSGIWQPVWLETVPAVSIAHLAWIPDVPAGAIDVEIELTARTVGTLRIDLDHGGEPLAAISVGVNGDRIRARIEIPRQINGQDYEHLLWSVEHPRLIDAEVTLDTASGSDRVYSYLGLRSVAVAHGSFMLNDRPVYLRSVLNQGYWPESHLAAPSARALKDEVELIKSLGFNAARNHQKIEDPRFLYWADRLGLMLWEEMPSVFEFSATAMRRVMSEWADVIHRDASHPSVVTWVPLNESWGVQHIAHSLVQQNYARALFHQTKALDPTRPVISNDGWEHLESDIWSIHDYEADGETVRARYADAAAIAALDAGPGPQGRRLKLDPGADRGQPIMLTEFGGIQYGGGHDDWGYSAASSPDDFAQRVGVLLDAVRRSTVLAGFCYTQLTDTRQEVNGLVDENRHPKVPIEQLRKIVTG